MRSHLPNAPVLASFSSAITAEHYNRVRIAFRRLGVPQEILLGRRGLRLRLDREVWLCSDSNLNDTPLVAWSRFEPRQGIHSPVACQVLYYHAYARVIASVVLTELDLRLRERLAAERKSEGGRGARVLSLRR